MLLTSIYSHKSFPGNLAVPLPVPMDHFLSEEWWQSCLAEVTKKILFRTYAHPPQENWGLYGWPVHRGPMIGNFIPEQSGIIP